MELEVGMYVRTRQGKIDRLIEKKIATNKYGYCYDFYWYMFENTTCIDCKSYIKEKVKPSHSIIDLIEVGDLVVVDDIKYTVLQDEQTFNNALYIERNSKVGTIRTTTLAHLFSENKVQEICTKEQFSSVSYKLGKEY